MSLINQMLRDLDARQAPNVDRIALPGMLHPLPPEPPRPGRATAAGLLLLAAAGVYWLRPHGDPAVPPVPAPVVTPATAPAMAPRPVAPVQPPPPAPAAPSVVTPVETEPPPSMPSLVPPLAPPSSMSAPVQAEPRGAPSHAAIAARPKPKAEAPRAEIKPPAKPVAAEPVVASKAAAAPLPAPAEGPPAAIDKQSRSAPANQAADAEYRKAMAALRRGTVSEAIVGLRAALALDKHHASARQALLSVLVEQQQWQEAQALVEDGLGIDPAQSGWAMTLARLQLEQGKLAEAADTLARHAPHAEQNADYLAFQALLLQKQRRFADAAQRYRAALALKPEESRWWYALGLALESEQKPQEARAAFLQARQTGNLAPELAAAVDQRLRQAP